MPIVIREHVFPELFDVSRIDLGNKHISIGNLIGEKMYYPAMGIRTSFYKPENGSCELTISNIAR